MKVNYSFQKAERERAKLAKKEAKRRERQAATTDKPDPAPDTEQTEAPAES